MWTQGVRSCLRFFPHWTSVEGREARITLNKEDWAEILFKKISHIFDNHIMTSKKCCIYMKTSRELFYWFEFKDIQILLYIAAFRTKVKAEKGELQFQNMKPACSWGFLLVWETLLRIVAENQTASPPPPPLPPFKLSSLRCKSTLPPSQPRSKKEKKITKQKEWRYK